MVAIGEEKRKEKALKENCSYFSLQYFVGSLFCALKTQRIEDVLRIC